MNRLKPPLFFGVFFNFHRSQTFHIRNQWHLTLLTVVRYHSPFVTLRNNYSTRLLKIDRGRWLDLINFRSSNRSGTLYLGGPQDRRWRSYDHIIFMFILILFRGLTFNSFCRTEPIFLKVQLLSLRKFDAIFLKSRLDRWIPDDFLFAFL